ncbi:MAG: GDSL-type esterase/lipase family protein [Prolixibacteraceae bacterium]|nr:GDSL-type esterase/lipase family protein [Prolixibacteraceae bacterium]
MGQNTVHFQASDANIVYSGRIDNSNPDTVVFSYPGVSIRTKFQGTSIAAKLTEMGSGSSTTTNYFNVIVDGGEPTVLKLSIDQSDYELVSGLANVEHTQELFNRTESNVGKVAFQGFLVDEGKKLLPPDSLPTRKIEFIGNSITCGYGNEIAVTDPDNYHFKAVNENNYKAWGAVTARNLDAQYSCIAYSGKGLFQNNTGRTNETMPILYDRILADDVASVWDHSKYVPDLIVINLGTNDFAAETNNAAFTLVDTVFINCYIDFIRKLRTYYPNASIICTVGVMMSDYYPSGANQWTRIQQYVSTVVQRMNETGDSNVFYLKLDPQQSPYGEDWHPTEETHSSMASTLTDFISTKIDSHNNTGVNDLKNNTKDHFFLYPNPSTSSITIKCKTKSVLLVYNIAGNLVLQKEINPELNSIDLKKIPRGIYTATLIGDNSIQKQKLILK